jgi:hypothetical protein
MTDFTGMTRLACPAGCKADSCVITQRPFCAHPCLGGLQPALQSDPGAVLRFTQACKVVGIVRNNAGVLTNNELAQ